MKPKVLLFILAISSPIMLFAQTKIKVENIEIARDKYGIPHIFSETDAEAVYGVAWAQCEDNFHLIQESIALLQGRSSLLSGKKALGLDFLSHMFEMDKFVQERYAQDITPQIEAIVDAYAQGLNSYAQHHPKEIKLKGLFPVDKYQILEMYAFKYLLMTYSVLDIVKVLQDRLDTYQSRGEIRHLGSNAMAFNSNKTADGKTYIVGNPHQPVEGGFSFWETSIHSNEGLEVFGVCMSGGSVLPNIGANRHLAWTHTTNDQDFGDIYELTMHPEKKNFYEFDGQWLELEEKKAKLFVPTGLTHVPVKKKYWTSIYGPTLRKNGKYYSFRNNCRFNIRHVEQWYKMAKAQNFDEFWQALKVQGLPSTTITYADYEDNIMFYNNGLLPIRDESYDWRKIVPGNTSKTLWSYDEVVPTEELIHVKNPTCGFVYTNNNTPLDCTKEEDCPKLSDYPQSWGILTTNTARTNRIKELIGQHQQVSLEDIKRMRDDTSIHSTEWNSRECLNMTDIFTLLEQESDMADVLALIQRWDKSMEPNNKDAAFMAVFMVYMEKYIYKNYGVYNNIIPKQQLLTALKNTKKYMLKHYGTLEVELGKVQKVVRKNKELPMYGSPMTLANAHFDFHKNGKLKLKHADTYIYYAGYGDDGLETLKAINIFGNSANPKSPHYTDQMELYSKRQVRNVELDNKKLKMQATRVYHPK